jgi:hypothetical protein
MCVRWKFIPIGIVALTAVAWASLPPDAVALDVGGAASGAAGAAGDAAGGAAGAAGSAAGGAAGAAGSAASGAAGAAGSAASGAAGTGSAAVGSGLSGIGSLGRDIGQALGSFGSGTFGPSAVFGPEVDPFSHPKAKTFSHPKATRKAAKKKPPKEPEQQTSSANGSSTEPTRTRRMCGDILGNPAGYDPDLVQLCRKVSSK